MEKPEEPKDISDIQANDYIESIDRVKVFIFRNINDYPFPIDKQYNYFNEKAVQLVKKALSNINRRSKIGEYFEIDQESLIIIKNNGVDILHNDNMQKYDLDSDFPKNRGLIIFIYPHLYATVNDINHVNFIISNNNPTKKDDLKNELENLINVVNRFSREIKFAFDDKFGFMTTCPKFMGNGVKISIDLKLNKFNEDYLNKYVKDKNMTWSVINENKDGKTIIRLENKCSFEQSETEMFCNWIYYINELVNESVND
jgi:protein-arginine kinase